MDAHRDALLVRRDLAAALAPLAAEPSVMHIPAMTGAAGRRALERFYADQFLPHLPGDLVLSTISRTVDRWRLVEETTVGSRTTGAALAAARIEPTSGGPRCWPSRSSASSGGRPSQRVLRDDATLADSWASPREGYWPSSQRPGAMSCGPARPPGAWCIRRDRGRLDSSGSITFHAAASPSGRVYSERSPISGSWISRT